MTPRDLLRILAGELRRRPYLIGFAIVLAGLAIWAVLPSPTRAIKDVIHEGERTIEARDVEALRPILAASFYSPQTGDREHTIARLANAFQDLLSIEIQIEEMRIQMAGNRATAEIGFHVSGAFSGGDVYSQIPFRGLMGSADQLERCHLELVKEQDEQWRIASAEILEPAPAGTASP